MEFIIIKTCLAKYFIKKTMNYLFLTNNGEVTIHSVSPIYFNLTYYMPLHLTIYTIRMFSQRHFTQFLLTQNTC